MEGRLRSQPRTAANWIQLGVLVNDGSGSMTFPYQEIEPTGGGRTKAKAVDDAVSGLIDRLQTSRLSKNFCLSCISFNERVTDQTPPQTVEAMSSAASYDPTAHGVGATAIHRGLDAADSLVSEFIRESGMREVPSSAVVVLLTDGEETDDVQRTVAIANQIKQHDNVDLAACLFATQGQQPLGEDLLKQLVSEPRLYKRVHTTEELRTFFFDTVTSGRLELSPGAQ